MSCLGGDYIWSYFRVLAGAGVAPFVASGKRKDSPSNAQPSAKNGKRGTRINAIFLTKNFLQAKVLMSKLSVRCSLVASHPFATICTFERTRRFSISPIFVSEIRIHDRVQTARCALQVQIVSAPPNLVNFYCDAKIAPSAWQADRSAQLSELI